MRNLGGVAVIWTRKEKILIFINTSSFRFDQSLRHDQITALQINNWKRAQSKMISPSKTFCVWTYAYARRIWPLTPQPHPHFNIEVLSKIHALHATSRRILRTSRVRQCSSETPVAFQIEHRSILGRRMHRHNLRNFCHALDFRIEQ